MGKNNNHSETVVIIVMIAIFLFALNEIDKSTEVSENVKSVNANLNEALIESRYGDQIDQDLCI